MQNFLGTIGCVWGLDTLLLQEIGIRCIFLAVSGVWIYLAPAGDWHTLYVLNLKLLLVS